MTQTEQEPIITTPLRTDLYKMTMGQGVFHNFPNVRAGYEFINRGRHQFPERFGWKLQEQVEMMSDLALSPSDRQFLEVKCPYLTTDYLDWFAGYRFDPKEVAIEQKGREMDINIKGPWMRTIYWEVPLMALICELYYQETDQHPDADYLSRAKEKGELMRRIGASFLEFGTRRAFSNVVQRNVLESLIESAGRIEDGGVLLGTSNVSLAKEFNLNPSGTYAHEWVMAHAALFGYKKANDKAMETWAREYLGLAGSPAYPRLATTLTDTFTTNVFIKDFDEKWTQYYNLFRQDSGDPFEEGTKLLGLWQRYFDNPRKAGKGTLFSDNLNTTVIPVIHERFAKDELDPYGVGTFLSNDVGVRPLNIVIKARAFARDGYWIPVCKLSDDRGKESGHPAAIQKAKEDFGLA